MKKIGWLILIAVAVIIIGWFWTSYNRLVTANEGVDNQWAQVEVQYQRRFDLIPNLVSSVQGIMAQEQTVFGDLADARTRYTSAVSVNDKVAAANQVESSLGRLIAIMENYPQLKSSEAVQTLMSQLEGTENRVSVERGRFNDQVQSFNVLIKRFPRSLLAGMYGFEAKTYFQTTPGAEAVPSVNLDINQ